jgi:hypothetical protein
MSLDVIYKQVYVTTKLNDVNDAAAGDQTAGGTGTSLYSLLGVRILLDNVAALALSDTTVGTLYGGIYQYVNFLSGGTASPARGLVAFWASSQTGANLFASDGATQYTVHVDAAATTGAGFWAGAVLNSVTKGNFGWVQIAGLASFQSGSNTGAAPSDNNIGDLAVVSTTATVNLVDALADATSVTCAILKKQLGVFAEAPGAATTAAIKRVLLKNNTWVF